MTKAQGIINRLFASKGNDAPPDSVVDVLAKVERAHRDYSALIEQRENIINSSAYAWGDDLKQAEYAPQLNEIDSKLEVLDRVVTLLIKQLADAETLERQTAKAELKAQLTDAQQAHTAAQSATIQKRIEVEQQERTEQELFGELTDVAGQWEAFDTTWERLHRQPIKDAHALLQSIYTRGTVSSEPAPVVAQGIRTAPAPASIKVNDSEAAQRRRDFENGAAVLSVD